MRILSLLLMFHSMAFAQWTDEQKALAAVSMAATVVDYGQTKWIAESRGIWNEHNRCLGMHPSPAAVKNYFIAAPIVSYLILDNISSERRTLALRFIAAIEIGVVSHNYSVGVRTSF